MGLPGSGKTYLTERLVPLLSAAWYSAVIVVWMNTIKELRYEDTNKLFQIPEKVDYHITEWNEYNHENIANKILHGKNR